MRYEGCIAGAIVSGSEERSYDMASGLASCPSSSKQS